MGKGELRVICYVKGETSKYGVEALELERGKVRCLL